MPKGVKFTTEQERLHALKLKARRYRAKPGMIERIRAQSRRNGGTPEGRRRKKHNQLRLKYGIGMTDYDRMLALQNGVCAICGGVNAPAAKRGLVPALHVDHTHKTGAVRGLLCEQCNRGLGMFRDDPERLRTAITYLEDHAKVQQAPTANDHQTINGSESSISSAA